MARMGVFSRNDSTPDSVPRSLQLLSHRKTLDARYMEIYPNFAEILSPNESISLQVTNFVRSIPMLRPQMSRVRVYQKFVAVPLRLMWSAWEDYIKGENDAQFLYEEPYVVNSTDGAEMVQTTRVGSFDGITFDGGFAKVFQYTPESLIVDVRTPVDPTSVAGAVKRRGVLLDKNSYVPQFISRALSNQQYSGDSQRMGYMKVGVHELADYFNHPLYVSTGKAFWQGYGEVSHPFSAFKFCAYQLAYSYFERSPNVQTRVDDFYQMSQDDCYDYPSVVACVNPNNVPVPADSFHTSSARLNVPMIRKAKTVTSGSIVDVERPRDISIGNSRADILRSSWEFVEKFPLKSGANLSMLASQPDSITGLPTYVPSNISLTRKRFANWQTDYFTSCNPWQQRGDEAQIPVSGSLEVTVGSLTFNASIPSQTVNVNTPSSPIQWYHGNKYGSFDGANTGYQQLNVYGLIDPDGNVENNTHFALANNPTSEPVGLRSSQIQSSLLIPGQDVTGQTEPAQSVVPVSGLFISPSNFRFAMTLQHIKEMQAQIDNRYQSYIHKFFGARARDYRLDRPEFLGGSVMELNVSDVTQTSESTDSSLLGDLAGKSVSSDTSRVIRYHADEHTVILGLIHIQPDTEYIGGLSRIDSTQDRFDWPLPQFSHLSEQAVYNWELSYNGLSIPAETVQKNAFGYQPVLNHLRWCPNTACGAFRDTLNSAGTYEEYKPWIAVRDFGARVADNGFITFTTPTLSDEFLSGRYNRDNSNFAVVDDEKIYPFMIDSYFNERVVRTISTRGTPRRLG